MDKDTSPSIRVHQNTNSYIHETLEFDSKFYQSDIKLHVVVMLRSVEMNTGDACSSDKCHGDSQCKQLPYSKVTECQCVENFDGERCQHHTTNSLSSTLSLLISSTLKIPTLSDIYFDVQDLQKQINEELTDVSETIRSLKTTLQDSYKRISIDLGEKFKWTNLKIDYSETIRDVLYYIKEFNRKGITEEGRKELASHIIKLGMVRKWASDLNTLFVGSQHILQDHKPLMILYICLLYTSPSPRDS